MGLKKYNKKLSVYQAAKERISYAFDQFDKIYISFSGGKDSSVMLHMVLDEAIKRDRKVGVLLIDLEAQYKHTIDHSLECFEKYKNNIEPYWLCLPMSLRNAVSNFEPKWICWDDKVKNQWVRDMPDIAIQDTGKLPYFVKGMEFEELMVEFGKWYSNGKKTMAFIGIRCDESLNRFRTIASSVKEMYKNKRWTTLVDGKLYNAYPIYDWKTADIWKYFGKYPEKKYNVVYDYMQKAGVPLSQQRLCQPYGDDQRKGLWLYHILEPETWYKLLIRVNGVNSGALYIKETGNMTGYNKISKPKNHSWKSFCNLLLKSLPKLTSEHYIKKFKVFLKWWGLRGYPDGIPLESDPILEAKKLAPSWRRLCKVLLRNDYWCKGLNFTQPKSAAYGEYLEIKKERLDRVMK